MPTRAAAGAPAGHGPAAAQPQSGHCRRRRLPHGAGRAPHCRSVSGAAAGARGRPGACSGASEPQDTNRGCTHSGGAPPPPPQKNPGGLRMGLQYLMMTHASCFPPLPPHTPPPKDPVPAPACPCSRGAGPVPTCSSPSSPTSPSAPSPPNLLLRRLRGSPASSSSSPSSPPSRGRGRAAAGRPAPPLLALLLPPGAPRPRVRRSPPSSASASSCSGLRRGALLRPRSRSRSRSEST